MSPHRAGLRVCALLLSILLPGAWAEASPVYNGGPVMSGPNTVDFIWYGNWTGNTATSILPSLITNLSGSSYMNILSSYNSPTNAYAPFSNLVNFGSSYFNTSTTALNGTPGATGANTIYSIVNAAINAGAFGASPNTSNTIFDVLTAPGISVSGFLTSFCGWHDSTNAGGNALGTQYGFIGDPGTSGCEHQTTSSPNNNVGADAMASVISHELFETITDPTIAAWYDSVSPSGGTNTGGFENGDMCNFNFGPTYQAPNGSLANVNLNGTNYLLQQQWINQGGGQNYAGGACATSLAFSNPTAAPEPGSLAVLASALAGLAALRQRRPHRPRAAAA